MLDYLSIDRYITFIMTKQDVYSSILAVAQDLMQRHGFNAFSYRDIANVVGVKTSSIHYHFPTKADLAKAVMEQHQVFLAQQLQTVMMSNDAVIKKIERFLEAVFDLTYYDQQKMCLGGMLASDIQTLPEVVQVAVRQFFTMIEQQLIELLESGIENNELMSSIDCHFQASIIVTLLEGGLLLARLYQDDNRLKRVKQAVLAQLQSFFKRELC